ncbi:MAG: hypothetical protein DMG13_33750 [Acidobacteria bacterium]|nr:MAG: hypothetical protein DMG13_33750 [Acidobacteriota bacterium]
MWTLFFFEADEESVGTLAIMQTASKETRLLSLKFFIFLALVKVLGLRVGSIFRTNVTAALIIFCIRCILSCHWDRTGSHWLVF